MRRSLIALVLALATGATAPARAASVCYGTPERGRLEQGVPLPVAGPNFEAYALLGRRLGRTYVHSEVRDIAVEAYARLEQTAPGTRFVYGETGFAAGGAFPPHKTHRNGLSVDFMVPVRRGGRSMPLPATAFNRYGYDLEFDRRGRLGAYAIDFEAIGRHLLALDRAAAARGHAIRRVIFDVPLQGELAQTPSGAVAMHGIALSQSASWVRHDEHYHVDFAVACEAMR